MASQCFLQERNFNTFSFRKVSSFHCLAGCFFPKWNWTTSCSRGILRLPQDLEVLEEHSLQVGCTQSGQIFYILRSRTVSATNPSGFTHSQLLCTTRSQYWLGFAHIYEIESAFGLYFFPIYNLACHFVSHLLDSTVCLHKELDVKQIWSIQMVFSEPMQRSV